MCCIVPLTARHARNRHQRLSAKLVEGCGFWYPGHGLTTCPTIPTLGSSLLLVRYPVRRGCTDSRPNKVGRCTSGRPRCWSGVWPTTSPTRPGSIHVPCRCSLRPNSSAGLCAQLKLRRWSWNAAGSRPNNHVSTSNYETVTVTLASRSTCVEMFPESTHGVVVDRSVKCSGHTRVDVSVTSSTR